MGNTPPRRSIPQPCPKRPGLMLAPTAFVMLSSQSAGDGVDSGLCHDGRVLSLVAGPCDRAKDHSPASGAAPGPVAESNDSDLGTRGPAGLAGSNNNHSPLGLKLRAGLGGGPSDWPLDHGLLDRAGLHGLGHVRGRLGTGAIQHASPAPSPWPHSAPRIGPASWPVLQQKLPGRGQRDGSGLDLVAPAVGFSHPGPALGRPDLHSGGVPRAWPRWGSLAAWEAPLAWPTGLRHRLRAGLHLEQREPATAICLVGRSPQSSRVARPWPRVILAIVPRVQPYLCSLRHPARTSGVPA